jgi:serine/threonine-protein kinase
MGLDAIHRAGIVHRDVSPENLMIARDDEGVEHVKIIDLGIAKGAEGEDNNTKTGMFVGKWKYCSPEHLGMLTPGDRIDGRADIYSFGIVLYEMLTGVPPFQADTPHAYLLMHSQTQPRAIRDTNPLAAPSPELEALVFRALEKDRTKRFATAREFGQAIDAIAPMLSETAGAPPPLPPSSEVTNEATRAAQRQSHEAATIVSIAQDAPTVAANLPPAKKPLDRRGMNPPAPSARPVQKEQKRRSMLLPIAALLLIALGVGGWVMMRKPAPVEPPVTQPVAQASTVSVPTQEAASAQQGRLGINAFPWANVTSIRNLDSGQNVAISTLVTPAPVDLAPGRYEVTLSNPQFRQPITRTVAIAAGEDETLNVTFRDPASATLPDFGVTR